jgi:hypothetical protein
MSMLESGVPGSELSAFSPSPMVLAKFFFEVSKGGPTAGAACWQLLDWWNEKVGFSFPTQSKFVLDFRLVASGHFTRQASELPLWVFLNQLRQVRGKSGTVAEFLRLVILLETGCIRWAHQKRSRLSSHLPGQLRFLCAKGKSPSQGSRPAFEWWVPTRFDALEDTLAPCGAFLTDLYRRADKQEAMEVYFVVPDVRLVDGTLTNEGVWIPRPMP